MKNGSPAAAISIPSFILFFYDAAEYAVELFYGIAPLSCIAFRFYRFKFRDQPLQSGFSVFPDTNLFMGFHQSTFSIAIASSFLTVSTKPSFM